jgi:hypothetical protein
MEQKDRPSAPPPGAPAQTLRLTFAYDGVQVNLVSQQTVQMITPAPTTAPPQPGQSGFWAELRDANDQPVCFRVLHDPFRAVTEAYSPGPKSVIRPREAVRRQGTFVVLLPEVPEARSIVLFGSPPDATSPGQPARELARFPLAQSPRQGDGPQS